jgi:hypothetical protein
MARSRRRRRSSTADAHAIPDRIAKVEVRYAREEDPVSPEAEALLECSARQRRGLAAADAELARRLRELDAVADALAGDAMGIALRPGAARTRELSLIDADPEHNREGFQDPWHSTARLHSRGCGTPVAGAAGAPGRSAPFA